MNTMQVIIQFVGLCLFSEAVPNDPGVHAILPRIVADHHQHANAPQITQAVLDSVPVPPAEEMIEEHVAMLVFPADIIADDSKWKARLIPHAHASLKDYRQITLNGEHVTFLADGPNAVPAVPPNMPRFTCPLPAGVAAPSLTPGYQWPYAQAAAVIDIPKGTLSACNPGGRSRVDTKLKLKTTGRLTVVGMKQGVARSLVLKTNGSPRIFVLNVPNQWAAPRLTATGGTSHYLAYYSMIGKGANNACSGEPRPVAGQNIDDDCGDDAGPVLAVVSGMPYVSDDGRPTLTGQGGPKGGSVLTMPIANAECSNSAWP